MPAIFVGDTGHPDHVPDAALAGVTVEQHLRELLDIECVGLRPARATVHSRVKEPVYSF